MEKKVELIDEWCGHCENEVTLKNEFKPQQCPICGEVIYPCSICDTKANKCSRCPMASMGKKFKYAINYASMNISENELYCECLGIYDTEKEA